METKFGKLLVPVATDNIPKKEKKKKKNEGVGRKAALCLLHIKETNSYSAVKDLFSLISSILFSKALAQTKVV